MTEEKKKDLTRIEDLSEYLHSDADNFSIPGLEVPKEEEDSPPPLPAFEYKNEESTEDAPAVAEEAVEPPAEEAPHEEEAISFTAEENTETPPAIDFETQNDFGSSNDFGNSDEGQNNWGGDLNALTNDTFSSVEGNENPENNEEPTFSAHDDSDETEIMQPPSLMDREEVEESMPTPSFLKKEDEPVEMPAPESFKEVKEFGQNISYTNLAAPGNPPFSVIIKDIKYTEDVEDIMILFKELGVVKESELDNALKALNRGAYLVPRISEFAAVVLCHKLRRFDLSILMGLADEIHPSKSFSSEDRGLVSKISLKQNQKHYFDFKKTDVSFDDIICTTGSNLHTHEIMEYLGPLNDTEIIELSEYFSHTLNQELLESVAGEHAGLASENATVFQNRMAANSRPFKLKETSKSENKVTIHSLYHQMLDRLKIKALTMKGNGIVNVHYQLVPLVLMNKYESPRYQITCSGDLVWLKKV